MVVKAQYLCSMQVYTNWYRNKHTQHHFITLPTRTKIHSRLEVNAVTYFHATPKSVCNRTQAKKAISRQPICLTDSDYDYILEEIGRRYKIEFEIDVESIVTTRKINMSILNDYYMFLSYIYI